MAGDLAQSDRGVGPALPEEADAHGADYRSAPRGSHSSRDGARREREEQPHAAGARTCARAAAEPRQFFVRRLDARAVFVHEGLIAAAGEAAVEVVAGGGLAARIARALVDVG